MAEEFDESVHTHDIHFEHLLDENKTTCCYCNVTFPSRNKLFYHLGYMNIDIRKESEKIDGDMGGGKGEDGFETDIGDFGFFFTKRNHRKKKKNNKKARRYRTRRLPLKKFRSQSEFVNAFNNMRLN